MMFNSCSHVFASSFTSGVYCTHPHISLLDSLSNLLYYDLVIAYNANCFTVTLLLLTHFQRGHKLIHGTFSGVCVHVDTNAKCPQFSNVYQKHCYLCLRWILRSIQFPVDYWHKMWSRALTHMGSALLLSHTVADRQKGHSGWSSLWKKRAMDNLLPAFPFVTCSSRADWASQRPIKTSCKASLAPPLSNPSLGQDQAEFPWISHAIQPGSTYFLSVKNTNNHKCSSNVFWQSFLLG